MSRSKINWLAAPGYIPESWNPLRGCFPISLGCGSCWARAMHRRFGSGNFSKAWVDENAMFAPFNWRKKRMVFVCSMGDLFYEDHDLFEVHRVFCVMRRCAEHRYLVLTKRPRRMLDAIGAPSDDPSLPIDHIWLGVSVEDQRTADERIPILLQTPAAVRFVSIEPMLGPIRLSNIWWDTAVPGGHPPWNISQGIDWVIIGCESGPRRRPCNPQWISDLIQQCDCAGIPVFVKQVADYNGRVSHDQQKWPEWARRQEWPKERNGQFGVGA